MNFECIRKNEIDIAVVSGDEKLIVDASSAIDLAMSISYESGADRIALDKLVIAENFFILSTGMAGEILQKFVNYHIKDAIWGNYSHYTGWPPYNRYSCKLYKIRFVGAQYSGPFSK